MRLADVPLGVIFAGMGAVAMLLPAMHGVAVENIPVARAFLQSAVLCFAFVVIVGLAAAGNRGGNRTRDMLLALVGFYTLLPAMLALPFYEALGTTRFANAWWEMLASLTTTGATLYGAERLDDTLHLWRAELGWLGGFFILVVAVAVLAPLRIGGFEMFQAMEGRAAALKPATGGKLGGGLAAPDYALEPRERMARAAVLLAPAYLGVTALLWLLLQIAGDPPVLALIHAMSTISTSGISNSAGLSGAPSGVAGEALIFVFLPLAVSRKFWPGGDIRSLGHDPEIRLAALLLLVLPVVMVARHWISAVGLGTDPSLRQLFATLWGGLFTVLSFLTTTGFEAIHWHGAREWSGLGAAGLTLAGLAIVGGGVATTAGGVRLLRCYALMRHGERELERIVHPSSIGSGGAAARRLRGEGAFMAWIFFMLFALSVAVVMSLATITGLEFEPAMVFSIAALSNTGPLAQVAGDAPLLWEGLNGAAKFVFALAMVVGRLETLAFIALLNPELWRN